MIPGWLFGTQTGRAKEDFRPKLIRYHRECFRVLWDTSKANIPPVMDPALQPPAKQALAQVEALYTLARNQAARNRLDTRTYAVPRCLRDAGTSAGVAHTLTEQNPEGKNYYQSIWSELHRRYTAQGLHWAGQPRTVGYRPPGLGKW